MCKCQKLEEMAGALGLHFDQEIFEEVNEVLKQKAIRKRWQEGQEEVFDGQGLA